LLEAGIPTIEKRRGDIDALSGSAARSRLSVEWHEGDAA